MPNIALQQIIPPDPWHWTTIFNYLLVLVALGTLVTAGGDDETPLSFLFSLAVLAAMVGLNLYIPFFPIPIFFIFFYRVAMFAIPVILAGLSPTESSRQLGVLMSVIAFPLFIMIFGNPYVPLFLKDPRLPW